MLMDLPGSFPGHRKEVITKPGDHTDLNDSCATAMMSGAIFISDDLHIFIPP